jgi:hypothetical protein
VAVKWEEPLNNGAAVSQYVLEMATHHYQTQEKGGEEQEPPASLAFSRVYVGPLLSYEVKCLQPAGTYSFRVQVRLQSC